MTADNEILHARVYDPVKAHEYYLRTRKLKPRTKSDDISSGPRPRSSSSRPSNQSANISNQERLKAQRDALEKRLEHLREVLREILRGKVEAAKTRSGVEKKDTKSTPDSKETKDKNTKETKDKPLTEKQKREKREASKEAYEKEHGTSVSREIESFQRQIKDIRAKIENAVKDARDKQSIVNGVRPLTSTERGQSDGRR